jgi:hypothetical protein
VKHPSPERLKAYANYKTDVDREVELHLADCGDCTDFVVVEMLRAPLTAEERGRLRKPEDEEEREPVG